MTAVRQRPAPAVDGPPASAAEAPVPVVLVVSDDPLASARIEALLRGAARWQVAVDRVSRLERSIARYHAAVVLLVLSVARAEQALITLGAAAIPPPIILLTSNVQDAWRSKALRRGLGGILDREATARDIMVAIEAARAGLLVLHRDVTRTSPSTPRAVAPRRDAALTTREIEILEMMAEGIDNRRIAARLGISRHTVKFHVASILDKLHAASRTEAVTIGIREGHISV